MIPVCGSLYAFLGDMKGQMEVMGLRGPRSKCPSMFSYSLAEDLSATYGRIPKERKSSDGGLVETLLNRSFEYGDIGQAKAYLTRLGYKELSCLWELKWFKVNYFQRFGMCYLHTCLWGNWLRHTIYLGVKYGDKLWKEVDGRLKKLPKYHNVRLPKNLFIHTMTRGKVNCP